MKPVVLGSVLRSAVHPQEVVGGGCHHTAGMYPMSRFSLHAWWMIILGAGESIPADIPCKKI